MSEDIDLKVLEKRAYRSTFEDGIWDLFIGLIILSLGLQPLFSLIFQLYEPIILMIPPLVCNILALLVFYLGKKYVTIPRIGFVKFGPKRKSKQRKLMIFLLFVFIVNLFLFLLSFTGITDYIQIEPLFFVILLVGVFTLPFCITAYFLDFTRLYYYSFALGLDFLLSQFLKPIVGYLLNTIIIFCTTGIIITLMGLFFFIQFLKKYPISK